MAQPRKHCGSRNASTGKPCKLPVGVCKYRAHREPDKARASRRGKAATRSTRTASAAATPAPGGSAAQQGTVVHPGGPTAAQLQQMLQQHQRGILSPAAIERDGGA